MPHFEHAVLVSGNEERRRIRLARVKECDARDLARARQLLDELLDLRNAISHDAL